MTIKSKLLSSFIVIIMAFGTLAVYLVYLLFQQGQQTIYAFHQPLQAVVSSQTAADKFKQAAALADNVLAMTMPSDSNSVITKYQALKQEFNQAVDNAQANALTDNTRGLGQSLLASSLNWFEQTELHLSASGHQSLQDMRLLRQQQTEIAQMLTEFAQQTLEDAAKIADDVEQATEGEVQGSIIVLLVFTLAALFVSFYLTKNLLRPIDGLKDAAIALSRGDGDLTRRLVNNDKDEIDALSKEFNSFIDKVQHIVSEIAGSVIHTHGKLSEFSRISDSTQQGTEQQKVEIERVNESISQVLTLGSQVTESSESAQRQSDEIVDYTKQGVELTEQSNERMALLTEKVEAASDVIFSLSNSSGEINSVIEVIQVIADQTNLLALNAAIEAARAGEAGRGFAVVAEEVRALAIKTQESTSSIQQTIAKVQGMANEAKDLMEVGRDQVHSCREVNLSLTDSLSQVLDKLTEIQQVNGEVGRFTQEQELAVKEVNEFLNRITLIANETAKDSLSLKDNSVEVLSAIEHVNANVSTFKLA
ncbi:methyl-accepting chemotaxis protein [Thalassotalea montiporae]